MKYYISDLHLGDSRVFQLCCRPYTIDDFNELIVRNWNYVVKDDDEVFIVGDLAQDDYQKFIGILKRLNGIKLLIVGNHDIKFLENKSLTRSLKKLIKIKHYDLINDQGRVVFLSHYPAMDWMEYNRGSYHIYGHIHNKNMPEIKNYYKDKLAFNASCDVIGYVPRTLDELIRLKEKNKHESYIN